LSLWALAWSDVSVQHLVPKLGESTMLRLRSESYICVASYMVESYLRAVFMLGVLTYLFYLLSKPNIPFFLVAVDVCAALITDLRAQR